MIDIHCHILPNVPGDDGSPDMEETVKMFELARADGIDTIICTPHGKQPAGDQIKRMDEIRAATEAKAAEYGIKLLRGLEYNLPQLFQVDENGVGLAGTSFMLIDFVRSRMDSSVDAISRSTHSAGFHPICAHPERLFQSWEQVHHIYNAGYTMQLTAASILGDFGHMCQKFSLALLDHGLCHYIASDAHSTSRAFRQTECRKFIVDNYGEETANILFDENPKRLLANQMPLEIPVVSDDYDDDLPKNPILRSLYRFFTGHRRDEEDED